MVWKIKAAVAALILIAIISSVRKGLRNRALRRKAEEDIHVREAAHRKRCIKTLRTLLERKPVKYVMTDPSWYLLGYQEGHVHFRRGKDAQAIVFRHREGDLTLSFINWELRDRGIPLSAEEKSDLDRIRIFLLERTFRSPSAAESVPT